MMGAKTIGCINHPGTEAAGRCRQCGKPVCGSCSIRGESGIYCSDDCREKHELFMKRAKDLGFDRAPRQGIFSRIRQFVGSLIVLAAILVALGVLASMVDIPVLSEITHTVRTHLGI